MLMTMTQAEIEEQSLQHNPRVVLLHIALEQMLAPLALKKFHLASLLFSSDIHSPEPLEKVGMCVQVVKACNIHQLQKACPL